MSLIDDARAALLKGGSEGIADALGEAGDELTDQLMTLLDDHYSPGTQMLSVAVALGVILSRYADRPTEGEIQQGRAFTLEERMSLISLTAIIVAKDIGEMMPRGPVN